MLKFINNQNIKNRNLIKFIFSYDGLLAIFNYVFGDHNDMLSKKNNV